MPEDRGPKIHVSRHLTRLTMDAQLPSIVRALLYVFDRYQVEMLDLEVLLHFALRQLDVTPDTYFMVGGAMRQILTDHERFSFTQGAPRESYETLAVRRVLVHLTPEKPTERPPGPPTMVTKVKLGKRGR